MSLASLRTHVKAGEEVRYRIIERHGFFLVLRSTLAARPYWPADLSSKFIQVRAFNWAPLGGKLRAYTKAKAWGIRGET